MVSEPKPGITSSLFIDKLARGPIGVFTDPTPMQIAWGAGISPPAIRQTTGLILDPKMEFDSLGRELYEFVVKSEAH